MYFRPEQNNNDMLPFLFNSIIDAFNLREIEVTSRKYTWANYLQCQTFEKLDRVLACTDFEATFPHTTVHALTREISDHTPLLLNTGDPSTNHQPQFKFELGWLLCDGFCEMVREIWQSTNI